MLGLMLGLILGEGYIIDVGDGVGNHHMGQRGELVMVMVR